VRGNGTAPRDHQSALISSGWTWKAADGISLHNVLTAAAYTFLKQTQTVSSGPSR